ncbi:hypothetical protein Tco_0976616 [Tanacetum coccineum]|uniref:Uncharacterized protein n=1 Tax=Tanacetum coccineum TaxID=301880 RepID=A0ABQ5EHX8_9ASTR
MEGWKPKSLKNKSFANIQEFFEKAMKRVNTFVDYRTELVEESSKKVEIELEENLKKAKAEVMEAELQSLIEVIPDEEEVAIDVVPLATKPPTIVDWKIHKEGKNNYYQIIRADESSKMYRVFSQMLKSFDMQDLEDLYKLVKAKYGSTRPVEDLDLILYGDLKTMFKPHVEDQVWKNQDDYKVLDWKLYDSCGVHSLRMQHVYIHILVEKKYPLKPSTITDMLNKSFSYYCSKIKTAERVSIVRERIKNKKERDKDCLETRLLRGQTADMNHRSQYDLNLAWVSKQVGLAGDLGSTNDVLIPLVEMDDANLTMEEYIKLEAEKYLRRGQMFNWETAAYEKASPLDDNEIDFRISFDESGDEDYTFMYDKNSYSSKLIPVNNLKTDLENDSIRVNVSSGDIVIKQGTPGIDNGGWRARVIDMEELADPAPIQAPQAPPVAAPGPRTKPQSMAILKEEVHGLRDSLGEQRAVLDEMSRDFSRFDTWTVGCLSQLLDMSGMTYTSYGDYQIPYQRRTKRRTDGASTSAASHTDDQPDL